MNWQRKIRMRRLIFTDQWEELKRIICRNSDSWDKSAEYSQNIILDS